MAESSVTQISQAQALEQGLLLAIACHRAGRVAEAEQLYVALLQAEPLQPDANHNLGLLYVQARKFTESFPFFLAAIEADPTSAQYWLSYIEALVLAEQWADARLVLSHARSHGLEGHAVEALAERIESGSSERLVPEPRVPEPRVPERKTSKGKAPGNKSASASKRRSRDQGTHDQGENQEVDALVALFNAGRYAEGECRAREMTERSPKFGFGFKVLGALLQAQGRGAEALEHLRTAATLLPGDAEVHSNLGVVFSDLQQWPEAEQCQQRAIKLQPAFAMAHYNLGVALRLQGKFGAAEREFRKALQGDFHQAESKRAECHFNLALSLQAQSKLKEAADSYRDALNIKPLWAEAHNNLACLLKDAHRYSEAERHYGQALEINPNLSEPHHNLGLLLDVQGRCDEAEHCIRRAIGIRPDYVEAHNNLGIVLKHRGCLKDAELCFRQAVDINPGFVESLYNLANCLVEREHYAEAEEYYRKALDADPTYAPAYNNFGNMLEKRHRSKEAEQCHRRALELDPGNADAHCNLGNALRSQGKLTGAESSYRHALSLKPHCLEALFNLGVALAEQHRFAAAEESYRRVLELNPAHAEAAKNLGNTLKDQGRFSEAELCYRRALELKPDYVDALSNLLFDLNYAADRPIGSCVEEARRYGRMVDAAAERLADSKFAEWSCTLAPQRLRVGIVSADLHSHPVGFFLEAMLERLATRFELIAYTAHFEEDGLTARIKPRFAAWKSIVGLTDAEAAKTIHSDGVHVLLDLSGHTARNRLPMFAYRPAPVQASWLGYFATTGVTAMDYVLGDPYVIPLGEEDHFTERVWRLPEGYLCFTPPNVDLAINDLPAWHSGEFTFGCFNNLTKMTDAVVAVWSRILKALPTSRLLLKTRQLDDSSACDKTRERFAAHGVPATQLLLEGGSPRTELLATYGYVDVALDPFPYPGGTTSVEGLWMGVPVITRKGDRFVSHVGESIAHNAGLSDWIAQTDEDYVAKAIDISTKLNELAMLRATLRSQVLASPLFDARRFAGHFENALWGMWRQYRDQRK